MNSDSPAVDTKDTNSQSNTQQTSTTSTQNTLSNNNYSNSYGNQYGNNQMSPYNRFGSMGQMGSMGYGNGFMRGGYGGNNNMMPQNNPQGFRQEYQGVLQGLQSLLSVSYAAVSFYSFGKIFIDLTKKLLNFLSSSFTSIFKKIFGFIQLKRLLQILGRVLKGDVELNISQSAAKVGNQGFLIILRILALICIFIFWKIREQLKKEQNQFLNEFQKAQEDSLKKQQLDEQDSQNHQEENQEQMNNRSEDFWAHQVLIKSNFLINQDQSDNKEKQTQNFEEQFKKQTNYLQDLPDFQKSLSYDQDINKDNTELSINKSVSSKPWKKMGANPFQ